MLDVRNGRVSFDDVLAEADDLHRRLERLLEESPLPDVPDMDAVNAFLADAYVEWWRERAGPESHG